MNKILPGTIFGLVFGLIDVAVMIPLKFEDRRKKMEAISGAFLERFMLGLLIPNVDLGLNYILNGLFLGLGLSVPTAIITRTYAPIVGIGVIGGMIMGLIATFVL